MYQLQIIDNHGTVTSTEEITAEPPAPQGEGYAQICAQASADGAAIIGTNLDETPTARVFNVIASQGTVIANNLA